jgi:prolyl-tRNA synthetase
VPFRITVGKKIKEGKVELFARSTRASEDVAIDSVVQSVRAKIEAEDHSERD